MLTLLLSFVKVFRVLSTAFVWILLFAKCHNSAQSSWHEFTVLLTSHHSRSTRLLPYFATDSCTLFVTLRYLSSW